MESVLPGDPGTALHRGRLNREIKESLRDLGTQLSLYLGDSGLNTAMDQICAGYEDKDHQLLTGFLRRTADAARTAAERLTAS
jgi:hypothetical protein